MTQNSDEPIAALSSLVRRQRLLLRIAIAVAGCAVAVLLASLLVKSPAQRAADLAAPAPSVLTAVVAHRVLVSSVTVRGTVTAAVTLSVIATTSAGRSAIVTGLPKPVGSTVSAGDVVAQVSGRPLIALPGAIPSYRDLTPGMSGADITELQNALVTLGYLHQDAVDGTLGQVTERAVQALYTDRGFDPVSTQDVNADEADAILAAEQSLTAADQKLQADSLLASQASDAAIEAQAKQQVGFDESDFATQSRALARLRSRSGVEIPRGEIVFVGSFPATVGTISTSLGASLDGATGPMMTLNLGQLTVNATVPAGSQTAIIPGNRVSIVDDVNQRSAEGVVSSLGEFVSGSDLSGTTTAGGSTGADSSSSVQAGYPLAVNPDTALGGEWLGSDVRVTVTTARTSTAVLSVPFVAIHSKPDGSNFVYVLRAGRQRRVAVDAGVLAAGDVQVTPHHRSQLVEGDRVVTG